MKTIKLCSFLVLSLLLTFCNSQANKEAKDSQDSTKAETVENTGTPETQVAQVVSKIEVLDFHSTHRCKTCNAIEANTKYALETFFAQEMKDGKITFQSINVDEAENAELAEKFKAAGTSLFFNVIKDGTEKQVDLTEFAFKKGKDKEMFAEDLKSKITSELDSL